MVESFSAVQGSQRTLQRLVIQPNQRCDRSLTLTSEQIHYLTRVLRLQPSDRFIALITPSSGTAETWLAQITETGADLLEALEGRSELAIPVTLALALPKGNAFDEVVRQVTELGVSCILPVISDRTLLHPSPNKLERWRKIAQEATEQSERQQVPTLLDPLSWQAALSQLAAIDGKFLCWARGQSPAFLEAVSQKVPTFSPNGTIAIALGPEGGWTEREVQMALQAGFQTVSLGRRVLRSVTAPVAAMAIVSAVLEK
jgi:16S rRNA (uracil1498-N3)-methyltransferase